MAQSPLNEKGTLCPIKIWSKGETTLVWLYLTQAGSSAEAMSFNPSGVEHSSAEAARKRW